MILQGDGQEICYLVGLTLIFLISKGGGGWGWGVSLHFPLSIWNSVENAVILI